MKAFAALGLVGIVLAAAATVAVWASVADAPWESSDTAETLGAAEAVSRVDIAANYM